MSTEGRKVVVQKYGGSSVATAEKLRSVAGLVVEKKKAGHGVVVVVSAMGDTTDELLQQARSLSPHPDRRELDMLLTAGERISMSLLAIAIREMGAEAVSLTGSQSGIITTASHTNARIMEVRPFRIQDELDHGRIVIVAGYQGVSYRREITTLGRGGSDTTAVALAAALDASACEIYSDVEGVFSADPRIVTDARQLSHVGYEEMQEMASSGARVLNAAAVEFAKERGIALFARKTGSSNPGTVIRRDIPKPAHGVRGIAHDQQVVIIEAPGHLGKELLYRLDALGAHPKQISHSGPISCVFGLEDLHNKDEVAAAAEGLGGLYRDDSGTVSLIGEGITHDLSVMMRAFKALSDMDVGGVSTSRFRITLVLPAEAVTDAVRRLHHEFGLAHPSTDAVLT